jgi:hypothetical protein
MTEELKSQLDKIDEIREKKCGFPIDEIAGLFCTRKKKHDPAFHSCKTNMLGISGTIIVPIKTSRRK